jgi:hypothetical protein
LYAKYQAYYSGWLLRPLREQEYLRAAAYKRYAQRLAASYRVEAESWRQQIVKQQEEEFRELMRKHHGQGNN